MKTHGSGCYPQLSSPESNHATCLEGSTGVISEMGFSRQGCSVDSAGIELTEIRLSLHPKFWFKGGHHRARCD